MGDNHAIGAHTPTTTYACTPFLGIREAAYGHNSMHQTGEFSKVTPDGHQRSSAAASGSSTAIAWWRAQ
jgi:hypothetical protein